MADPERETTAAWEEAAMAAAAAAQESDEGGESGDDGDWSMDVSDSAVAARRQEMVGSFSQGLQQFL